MRELDEAAMDELGDPDCMAILRQLPHLDTTHGVVGLRHMAQEALAQAPAVDLPKGVAVRDLPAAAGLLGRRLYEPEQLRRPGSAILWIHGGGLVAGSPEQDDLLCADMAVVHGCPVIAVRYRLAPEDPHPAGLEDCFNALLWTLGPDSGLDVIPGRLVVAGASAGGCLALALALTARDRAVDGISGLLLHYPMLDDRPDRPSMLRAMMTRTWHRELNTLAWQAYLAGRDEVPITAAPGRAVPDDLRGLPPVYLDVGTLDAFYDEDLALARALAEADVPVELVVTPGAFHASEVLAPHARTSIRMNATRRDAMRRFLDLEA